MKTIITFCLAILPLMVITAQDDWYDRPFETNIKLLDSVENIAELQKCSVFFYRLWETNNDWLPGYYYTLSLLKQARYALSSAEQKKLVEEAETFIRDKLSNVKNNSEVEVLKAMINMWQYRLNNSDNSHLKNAGQHLGNARNLNKNNPRVYIVMAEYLLLSEANDKSPAQKIEALLERASQYLKNKKSGPKYYPQWGNKEIKQLLIQIKPAE